MIRIMQRIAMWIREHKLTTLLLIVVAYFVWKSFFGMTPLSFKTYPMGRGSIESSDIMMGAPAMDSFAGSTGVGKVFNTVLPPAPDYAPALNVANRLVVQNSSLSLLVTNVVDARNKILDFTKQAGGYMVQADTSNPQEEATATITVRVPSMKLDEALTFFRSQGVKVVSENLMGTDVTDQYVDIDARIETLTKTKVQMESLLDQAVQISDLTNLTREVIAIQSQIDSLKGQQESLKANADFTRVTLFLSTDEIALPYTPNETFRPGVVVKLAVRSLISHLRQLGTFLIWVAIYGVIWVPVLVTVYLVNRRLQKKTSVTTK